MDQFERITATGVIVPDASDIREEVIEEYKSVFGDDFIVDPSSDQGREIEAETIARLNVLRNNARVANQINPNLADSVFLDALFKLTGGERDPKERSVALCTLGGVAGTFIKKGSVAKDKEKRKWLSKEDATIAEDGSVEAPFESEDFGSILASAGAINKVSTGVLGWETITNKKEAEAGKPEQSDISVKKQRKIEIGKNSKSNSLAIIASISSCEKVKDVSYRENISGESVFIDGVALLPHSTWVCVDGGSDQDIADAYQIKSGGTPYSGKDVTVDHVDPNSGQKIPVLFDRPHEKKIKVKITAKVEATSSAVNAIKDAVLMYASGEIEGEDGLVLGVDVSPFEISSAVNKELPNTFITKCETGLKSGELSFETIENKIFEKATINRLDIEVVIL